MAESAPAFNPNLPHERGDEPPPFDPIAYAKAQSNPNDERVLGGLISKQTAQNWANTLPTIGALGGGAAGTVAGPAGMIGGAGLGAAGGKYLEGAIETALDLPDKPKDRVEAHAGPLKEGLLSATGEGAGLNLAGKLKGIFSKLKPADLAKVKLLAKEGQDVVDKIPNKAPQGLMDISADMFANTPKANAPEIQSAAGRLGTEATPGMLSSNKNLQNLEQVLSERPTIAGEMVRRRMSPIQQSLGEAAESVGARTADSPYELGANAQKSITGKIAERLDPLKTSFNEIEQSTSKSALEPKDAARAAGRLMNQELAQVKGTGQEAIISKYSNMVNDAKTASQLGQILSDAKNLERSASGIDKIAYQKVIGAIDRLQRRSLIKSAVSGAGDEGKDVAKGLINDIRQTRSGYRGLIKDTEGALGNLKLDTYSPGAAIKSVDQMPSAEVVEKLWHPKRIEALQSLKQFEPDAFEAVRQNKLNDVVNKSMTKGKIDPAKLVRNFKGMPKEAKELLVGAENVAKLNDAETIINSFPEIVGPSRTPRGLSWHNFNPFKAGDEISDAIKLRALSTGQMPTPLKALQKGGGLIQSPGFPPAVLTGSGLIRSGNKDKGQ